MGAGGKSEGQGEEAASSRPTRSGPGRAVDSGTQPSPKVGKSASIGLREILSEPGQTNRVMALLEYYSDLDPSKFESEMQKLQGLPMSQRMMAMNLLFARWAETDPQAALEQSRQMGFPERFMAQAGMVSGWAASNPEGLAQRYMDNPSDFSYGRGGGDTVGLIAGEWAKQNPEAAMKWALALEGRDAGQAIKGVFNELAQDDPQAALKLAESLSAEQRLDAVGSIAKAWAISDYGDADRWINSLSGEEKIEARFEAVESLAEISPARAAAETAKIPAGKDRDYLVAEVSEEWAQQDADAAFEWLTANGTAAAVEDGITRVVGALAREDAARAMDYIAGQPAGEIRDNAIQGYIYGNRDGAPAESMKLAESITSEESRQRTVTRVAYDWAREEPAAAIQYVESSPLLGEESKQRIVERAERAAAGEETRGRGFDGPRGPRGR